jgi:hypothetical protein
MKFLRMDRFMQGSELEQQLQALEEKYQIVARHIAALRQDLATRQQELATLTRQVSADRDAALRAKQQALAILLQTPPARNGREDRQRQATAALRPLTQTELAIIAKKRSGLTLLVTVLSENGALIESAKLLQLRQQAWQEWEYERRTLEQEIARLSQELSEQRETDMQRALRLDIGQIQRELSGLEQQEAFMTIDIKALKQRIAQAKGQQHP